jgi:hypothetical protein
LVPAFVFIKADSLTAKAMPLTFKVSGDSMVEEPTLRQQWVIQKITTEKLGRKGKFGNNLLGGTFTLLTGVSTDRVKAWKFMANIGFNDKTEGKQFTCKVPYIEEERDERIVRKQRIRMVQKVITQTVITNIPPTSVLLIPKIKHGFLKGQIRLALFK